MISFEYSTALEKQMSETFNDIIAQNQIKSGLYKYLSGNPVFDQKYMSYKPFKDLSLSEAAKKFVLADISNYTHSMDLSCISVETIDINKFLKSDPYFLILNATNFCNRKNNTILYCKILAKNSILLEHVIDRKPDFSENINLAIINNEMFVPLMSDEKDVFSSFVPSDNREDMRMLCRMKGNVVCFGLGIGYIPYIISLKNNVKNVVVIEENKDNISLFKESIEPYLLKKFKIINGNYYELFNDKKFMSQFDSCYIDFRNTDDAMLKFPLICTAIKNNKYSFNLVFRSQDMIFDAVGTDIYFYILDIYNEKCNMPLPSGNSMTWTENILNCKEEPYHKEIFKKIKNYFDKNKFRIKSIYDISSLIFDKETVLNIIGGN